MKVAPLTAIIGAYLLCRVTTSQQKELLWIQHPDVADFYEYLLDEREECKKANTSPMTELVKRVATIGKKNRKPPLSLSNSLSSQSSDSESPTQTPPRSRFHRSNSSSCRTTVLKTNREVLRRVQSLNHSQSAEIREQNSAANAEVYRFLRTSRAVQPRKMSKRSRYRAFPFLTQNMCPFHRKSYIKMMDTAEKQKLCDAELTLFAFLGESYAFPASEADAGDGQTRGLRSSARPILYRTRYGLQQNFIENIPKKKKKKKKNRLFSSKTKNEMAVEKFHSPAKKKKRNYVKIFVKIREGAVRVKAVPCIVHGNFSWFLVDGYGTGQYFTVERDPEETLYRVTGLLDAVPTVEVDKNGHPISPENLERSFRAMQDWIEKSHSRIELCGLDDIQKFRLCSAAYAAWQQYFTETARKLNFSRTFKNEDCIKNVKLNSKFQRDTYVSNIPVILVPCIVNNDEPAFYITADERSGSVFVVTGSSSQVGEMDERNYYLEILVKNIIVLRNIQANDLVVTCKRHLNQSTQEESEQAVPVH